MKEMVGATRFQRGAAGDGGDGGEELAGWGKNSAKCNGCLGWLTGKCESKNAGLKTGHYTSKAKRGTSHNYREILRSADSAQNDGCFSFLGLEARRSG